MKSDPYDSYRSAVSSPALRERLKSYFDGEDRYLAAVHEVLANSGATEFSGFVDAHAFTGGSFSIEHLIRDLCAQVVSVASKLGAKLPPLACGIWPNTRPNAQSFQIREDTGLILIHTGLIQLLRLVTQHAAWSLTAILGVPVLGPDTTSPDRAAGEIRDATDRLRSGDDSWVLDYFGVTAGPREQFRREMMQSALAYVIAHEVGHRSINRPFQNGWRDDNQEFNENSIVLDEGSLLKPASEFQVTDAVASENIADMIALQILREIPFSFGDQPSLPHVLGCLSAQTAQVGDWWRRAAYSSEPLGWTHPIPDIRTGNVVLHLTSPLKELERIVGPNPRAVPEVERSEGLQVVEAVAGRFIAWTEDVFDVGECKSAIYRAGLGNRGIDPQSLVYLYSTDPRIPRQPSDIVAATREAHRSSPPMQ